MTAVTLPAECLPPDPGVQPVVTPAMVEDALEAQGAHFRDVDANDAIGAMHAALETAVPAAPPDVWQPIVTAPQDGSLVWVHAPAREGLPAITCPCAWHSHAGWCVDELRHVEWWMPMRAPMPPVQP